CPLSGLMPISQSDPLQPLGPSRHSAELGGDMNRTVLILAATVPQVTVACSQVSEVPSEAENVDLLLSNRSDFEAAVAAANAEPRILRIERRARGKLHVLPTKVDCDRVASI